MIQRRFLNDYESTLQVLATVSHPSITHHLLQTLEGYIEVDPERVFRLVMTALTSGGATGQYQFESLGVDLFVKIVRRYLADYQSLLASKLDLQSLLVRALDIFAEVGWPVARQLVYEIPEMLR